MTERTITNIESFLQDPTQYKGEIFVNVSASTNFNDVKSFIDTNKLIAFLPGENAIYAQGHKYEGITAAQASQLSSYAQSIQDINDKLAYGAQAGPQSVIGDLTYGTGAQAYTADNVTDFILTVVQRIEAGDSVVTTQLETIEAQLAGLNNTTVKDYVDEQVGTVQNNLDGVQTTLSGVQSNLSGVQTTVSELQTGLTGVQSSVNSLGNDVVNLAGIVASGQYATRVTKKQNEAYINVELVDTENTNPETSGSTPFVPPYTYEISTTQALTDSIDQKIATGIQGVQSQIGLEIASIIDGAPASLDTLKEISDWITNHPDDSAAINSAITDLRNSINGMQGSLTEEVVDEVTGETVTHIKRFTNASQLLNGHQYAVSLEQINDLFNSVSFASNVADNAEPNKIDDVDFVNQDVSAITGVQTDNSVKLGTATLTGKNIGISLNTDILARLKSSILDTASLDATTKANGAQSNALAGAQAYVDERLGWVVM